MKTHFSPLTPGKIYFASDLVLERVGAALEDEKIKITKGDLALGLIAEYIHDDILDRNGWLYEKGEMSAPYDRILDGKLHDDKLRVIELGINRKISSTHTISRNEYMFWKKQENDVILHSWDMISEDFYDGFQYTAAISFRKLLEMGLIQPSNFEAGYYFFKDRALQCALANCDTMVTS